MQQREPSPTSSIFCAAAPSDMSFLAEWERHLLPLIHAGRITVWSEQHLIAGETRLQQINNHLHHAHVIVFLLSAEFFASDECMALMERALERYQQGAVRVIPLLLRPFAFRETKFATFTPLPSDGRFVTLWENPEAAFEDCVRGLRRILGRPITAPLVDQQQRVMLRRLHLDYDKIMKQSLQGTTWLELGLAEVPDAVRNRVNLLLRVSNRAEQPLPGTSIALAYDEAEHELLILGEPGAGKSTLLLDLAQQLVARAETDQNHPLPVILPLSTWAVKRGSLEDWIAEQMSEIYDVPRKLSVQWVQEERVLPLLDGLDEMEEAARPACIAAINAYHRERLRPLVVCSRKAEYEAAASRHRLALQGAVAVQSLTHEDVDAYLVQAGKPLSALRRALKKNEALRDLATTPLMLSVLVLTYRGTTRRELSSKGALLQQQVWSDYIERMVERKGYSKSYPLERTRAWLGWLARQMKQHDLTIFYLEGMQPSWLEAHQPLRHFYRAVRVSTGLVSALIGGLIFGLVDGPLGWLHHGLPGLIDGLTEEAPIFGLVIWLVFTFTSKIEGEIQTTEVVRWSWEKMWQKLVKMESLRSGLIGWLIFGFLNGPLMGLLFGQFVGRVSMAISNIQDEHSPSSTGQEVRYSVRNRVFVGLVGGLVSGLLNGLLSGLAFGLIFGLSKGPVFGLVAGLIFGLFYGGLSVPIGGLIIGLTHRVRGEVNPREIMSWLRVSVWRKLAESEALKYMLTVGFFAGLLLLVAGIHTGLITIGLNRGLIIGLNFGLLDGLTIGATSGLVFELISGMLGGMSSDLLDEQFLRKPNQGIQYSAWNSILTGLIGGLVTGLLSALIFGLNGELSHIPIFGLTLGLVGGLFIALSNGGVAYIQHTVLRMFLWHARHIPWSYVHFLDYATERILLRKVNGGYIFVHRLLLEYFASLEEEKPDPSRSGT